MTPYRTTPIFDEVTLPAALRREHNTKAGVWGVIRLLRGELRLVKASGTSLLTADQPGLIEPEESHWVEPLGPIQMQIEFYDRKPSFTRN
jgi:tellurite resistance-related uncharacterized protein